MNFYFGRLDYKWDYGRLIENHRKYFEKENERK